MPRNPGIFIPAKCIQHLRIFFSAVPDLPHGHSGSLRRLMVCHEPHLRVPKLGKSHEKNVFGPTNLSNDSPKKCRFHAVKCQRALVPMLIVLTPPKISHNVRLFPTFILDTSKSSTPIPK